MHTIKSKKIFMLKPVQIRIPSNRVRKNIDKCAIESLAESILANGIIEPLTVRKDENGYVLISGQRRLMAAQSVGLRRVPCVLYSLSSKEGLLYSVIENLQRKQPDYFEEARALEKLVTYGAFTHIQVASRLGISVADLSYKLQLLQLDTQLADKLSVSGLDEDFARLLLILPVYQRPEVLENIIENSLTFQQARELVEAKINPPPKTEDLRITEIDDAPEHKPVRKYAIGDVRMFANSLAKLTETLKTAGFGVTMRKSENDKYIEYKVRIKKESCEKDEFKQLKIC